MPIDMSAAVAPPKRGTRKPVARSTATAASVPTASLAEQRFDGLMGIGSLGQGLCFMAKQYAQAATFGQHWGPIAKETAALASSQPTVARYVDLIITAGPYVGLLTAVTPFVMQTLANYGLINAENAAGGGVVSPRILEAQMKAGMAQREAQAMREQQMAMEDAANAQREYEAAKAEMLRRQEAELKSNVDNHQWDPNLHASATVSQ